MLTIPLICEAGYGNLGDDLSVALVAEEIRKIFEYDVDIRPTTFTQALMGHMPPSNMFALLGPGTLLSMNDNDWNANLATMVDRGWEIGLAGTGIAHPKDFGETTKGRWLLGKILHNSPLLWLRGEVSNEHAIRAMRYYCADSGNNEHPHEYCYGDPLPMFYEPKERAVRKGGVIFINFGYTAYSPQYDVMRHELIKLTHLIREAGYTPKGWSVWPRNDNWPLRKLCTEAGIEHIRPTPSVRGLEKQLREATATVTFRLHAGLFSLACGIPAVMINYQNKIRDGAGVLNWKYIVEPTDKNLAESIAKQIPKMMQDQAALPRFKDQCVSRSKFAVAALEKVIRPYLSVSG